MSQQVIDLVSAAETLADDQIKLKKLILQLRDSHSIRTDLMLAVDFVGTMKLIGDEATNANAGGVAENAFLALFYSALMLYVRATKTQSANRRSLILTKTMMRIKKLSTRYCVTYVMKHWRITVLVAATAVLHFKKMACSSFTVRIATTPFLLQAPGSLFSPSLSPI